MTGKRSKQNTHGTGRWYRRTRRNRHETIARAEKQAERRARTAETRPVWADAPGRCPTCGLGITDRYRREPHYRRGRRLDGRPVWCPTGPFAQEVDQ